MLVGYARISTPEQNLDLQRDALKKCGCERTFTDVASGARTERQGLIEALDFLRSGDTLVVWKLDRLGRSLPHLIETVNALAVRQVGFRSLQEAIDTTTAGGKLIFHVFGALAEFERDLVRDRTRAGLSAAHEDIKAGGPESWMSGRSHWPNHCTATPGIRLTRFAPRCTFRRPRCTGISARTSDR